MSIIFPHPPTTVIRIFLDIPTLYQTKKITTTTSPLPRLLRKEITGNVAASGSKILKQLKQKVLVKRNGTGSGTEVITNRTM